MTRGDRVQSTVLVVAPEFPAINQPWIDTYLEQLLLQGIEPRIFSTNKNPSIYHEKVDQLNLRKKVLALSLDKGALIKAALKNFYNPKLIYRAWRLVKEFPAHEQSLLANFLIALQFTTNKHLVADCHLIHSHSEILAYRFLFLSELLEVPLVLTFHGLPPVGVGQLSASKRRVLYDRVSKVFVNTEFAKAQVCSLGCDPGKVVVIPQGLPVNDFSFRKREAPSVGESLHILSVGRYHRDKGQAYALLSARRLLDARCPVRWSFVGVGPDLQRLQKLAKRLSLEPHVVFHQGLPSEDLKRLYSEAHLFVFTSIDSPGGHVETQGVVLQEAQASGCIPIASRVGGIPECIHDREDALLVRQRSSRQLSDAIQFMRAHPDLWQQYQEAGRRNVEVNYSADTVGKQIAECLRSLMRSET